MALLRHRSLSGSSRESEGFEENDDGEEHRGLLDATDDHYDASKYKIPVLKQQMLMRTVQNGGNMAKVCMVMSVLGMVFLSTIALGISTKSLYWGRMYAEEEEQRTMIDGLAGAIVIYAITGSFSFLLVFLSSRPNSAQFLRRITENVEFNDD